MLDFGLAKLNDNLAAPAADLKDVLLQVAVQTGSFQRVQPEAASPTYAVPSQGIRDSITPSETPIEKPSAPSPIHVKASHSLVSTAEAVCSDSPSQGLKEPAAELFSMVGHRHKSDHSGLDLERAATLDGPKNPLSAASARRASTANGTIVGTPLYMAPEAWRGEPASAATDVYSLGALLYELCSGKPPNDFFALEDIQAAATQTDVPPLCERASQVDTQFAAIIDRCLRRDPAARFASAQELLLAVEARAAQLATPTVTAVLRQLIRQRWPVLLVVLALLLLPPIIALRDLYQRQSDAGQARELIRNRRSFAVLSLAESLQGTSRPGFAVAFADLLSAELAVGERLRRIAAERVARMEIDLKLPAVADHSPDILSRIHKHLGVDLVVTGSIAADTLQLDRLRIAISVLDSQTGAQLAATEVAGRVGELFELVTAAGTTLRKQLGLGTLSSRQAAALRAVRPERPHIAEQYAEGGKLLRRFDAVGARKRLERVIAEDPDYPLGHLALAEVLAALGYDEKAKAEAKRALQMSFHLPREDRYLIEARYWETTKDWKQAIATYQSLLSFFPDSLDYGLMLMNAQHRAGELELARITAKKLRQLPAPANQDPRLDILEAKVVSDSGEQQAACALLEQAVLHGIGISAPLIVARAKLEESYVLEDLGEQARALPLAETAKTLLAAAGDRGAAADALMAISRAYDMQGDLVRALSTSQEALDLLLQVENSSLLASHLNNMALLLIEMGNFPLAQARAEASLLLSRELGQQESYGAAQISNGLIETAQGNLSRAKFLFQNAAAVFKELGDPRMVAWALWCMGEATALQGDLVTARAQHEEAYAIRQKARLQGFAAESEVALAAIALEQRRPQEAEVQASAAAKTFAQVQQSNNEAWAQALLAQALVKNGKPEAARQAMERAMTVARISQNISLRLLVRRINILFQFNENRKFDISKGLTELDDLRKTAKESGNVIAEFEILLARLQLIKRAKKEFRDEAQNIAQLTAAKGLGLLEKKAIAEMKGLDL